MLCIASCPRWCCAPAAGLPPLPSFIAPAYAAGRTTALSAVVSSESSISSAFTGSCAATTGRNWSNCPRLQRSRHELVHRLVHLHEPDEDRGPWRPADLRLAIFRAVDRE